MFSPDREAEGQETVISPVEPVCFLRLLCCFSSYNAFVNPYVPSSACALMVANKASLASPSPLQRGPIRNAGSGHSKAGFPKRKRFHQTPT